MTFLNPAILFGLFAASIPVVLHFLNLRKLKKIEFSTLAFLKELQKTKIKRIKLKQWLLLLLRIAIIMLLVMAFARPTFKSISLGGTSAVKTTAVIIIDNTFSMSVVTEKGSYLNHAKQIAKNLLNNFQEGDEIVLLPLAESPFATLEPLTNFKQIARQIDDVPLSYVSRTINEAIINTTQILYRSKNFNKEIYLLTDLQKGRIFNSAKDLSNLSNIFKDNTRLFFVDVANKEAVNLGIEELIPNNQIFEKGKTVSFSATIKNYSTHAVNNSVVSLLINGKRSAQQSLDLSAGEAKEISFETTLSDTGLVEVTAELEDDDILQDNKRFFTIYVPDKISVLILTDNNTDNQFLKLAIEDPMQQKTKITENNLSQLPLLNLRNYDAVFIIGSEKNSDWKNLDNYLLRGVRLALMPGSQSTIQSFQKMCDAIGISAPTNSVGKINFQSAAAQFDRIDFQNPLFGDLFENKKQPQLDSPEIYYYFKILPDGKGKSIISMFDNSSFLSEFNVGSGKVFLFNSAPVLSWNTLPLKGFFAPLMKKLILFCSSKTKEQSTFTAGSEITADISNHSLAQIKIEKPSGINEFINSDSLSNQNYLSYKGTDEVGTYKFFSGNKLLDYISVNHDPRESVTERSIGSDFKDYLKQIGFEGKLFMLSPEDDFSKVIYQSRFGTELWKYFLIAVIMLAIVESLVARSSKKDLTNINAS